MIGNDIVDLRLASTKSNWRRKGYLNKIFTPNERDDIKNATDPNKIVWMYWSMKESAYKCISRVSNFRQFNPLQFSCFIKEIANNQAKGIVQYKDQSIHTTSQITEEYISTFTNQTNHLAYWMTFALDLEACMEPGSAVRKEIFFLLTQKYKLFKNQSDIIKDKHGIPSIIYLNSGDKHPISISHHGRFGSFLIPSLSR